MKDYNVKEKKGGFLLLAEKKNPVNFKIATADGEVVYSYQNNNKTGFLSGLKCGKFFTSKMQGSGNDGGGYTIFEYTDVELHDVKNPNAGVKQNYSLASLSSHQLFEFYNFFDINNKVGIINSCGEVIVPAKYNRISVFNESGQAKAYTDTDFTVLDTLGKSLLKQPFKHGHDKVFKYSFDFYDKIKDNRVKSSLDGKQFGIFDFKENKQLIPNSYDEITMLENLFYKVKEDKTKKGAYLVKKNDVVEAIDYATLKVMLPMSVGANGVNSISEINNKYLIIFSNTKKIIRQLSATVSNDESKYFKNIYYEGKVLFDPKLEIKDIEFYRDRLITLQLYNGGSKIYDLEKSKFIAEFPDNFVSVGDYEFVGQVSINKEYTYDARDVFFNISIPCKGPDCQTTSSKRGALCDYNGKLRTEFLQDASYVVVRPDKTQDKFFFFTYKRPSNFVLNFNLYDNEGKLKLENFMIGDNQKEYCIFIKDNTLILNEDIDNSVSGKTAFDMNGKMIGERYLYISEPSKKQEEKKSNYTPEQVESQKNNRFLKK